MARKSGFVKIKSTLTGLDFIKLMFENNAHAHGLTLNQLTGKLEALYGKAISKQGLDQRFSEKSYKFVKGVFETFMQRMLAKQTQLGTTSVQKFIRVRIKDGTRFELPDDYACYLKGFGGGSASSSAAGIQLEYDLKTGQMLDINLHDGCNSDSKYCRLLPQEIEENDLILRDLGYFLLDNIATIQKQKAYIISKLNAKTQVFTFEKDTHTLINFGEIYEQMNALKINQKEIQVYVGAKHKLKMRLVLQLVPDQLYEQRLRTANKTNKKKGYKTSDEQKMRMRFNLFITNIEEDKADINAILDIYKLRWQVELQFKEWKSTYLINKVSHVKYYRWITQWYARLLEMLIHLQVTFTLKHVTFIKSKKLISTIKCLRTLHEHHTKILSMVAESENKIRTTLSEWIKILNKKHLLEKKKEGVKTEEIMGLIY